jgi:hypothetical protein
MRQMASSVASYERRKLSLSVLVAMVSAIVALLFFYLSFRSSRTSEETKMVLQIVDAVNNSPIPKSSVELAFGNTRQSVKADEAGRVTFTIPTRQVGTIGLVAAYAEGFTSASTQILLGKDESVVLVPVKNSVSSPDSALKPYIQVFRSGPRPSGPGSDFSAWYELAAEAPKPGFVIDQEQSSFVLIGDRTCNGWSQCVRSEQTDTSLVWRFRMQGHNESRLNNGVTFSEAILKVTYVPRAR